MNWTAAEIKELRKARGETQAQFAEALGVSPFTVHNWESGKTAPSPMGGRALDALENGAQKKVYNQAK